MNNIEFFKKQFRKRQLGIKTILREDGPKPLMKNKVLERMIKQNIRGLDPDSAQKEIERLTIINRQLGYSLPEKYRIQKLIHPVDGRKDLNNPVLNISESINRLGDRLLPKASNLPFEFRVYQFLVDIAKKQNQANYKSDEILVLDVTKNMYTIFSPIDNLKNNVGLTDQDINNFINRIFVNNKIIFSYLDPNQIHEIEKIDKFANAVQLIPNLKESLFGIQPIIKQFDDIRGDLKKIIKNVKTNEILIEELGVIKSENGDDDDDDGFEEMSEDVKKGDVDSVIEDLAKLNPKNQQKVKQVVKDIKTASEEVRKEGKPFFKNKNDFLKFSDDVLEALKKTEKYKDLIKNVKEDKRMFNAVLNLLERFRKSPVSIRSLLVDKKKVDKDIKELFSDEKFTSDISNISKPKRGIKAIFVKQFAKTIGDENVEKVAEELSKL